MSDPANNPLDATDLAQLVSSGEASPLELVDQAIERIERLNPTINSVIHKRYDAARDEAQGDLPDGPFKGVPFLTKDLGCAIAGEPMHLGNKLLKEIDLRSPVDSFLYEGFKSAGLITLGRTNTPELGSTVTTEPLAYGPTRSPWNLDHSVGGSSGGSAASVASGMVSMAHANDGGGSIRVPASECGLVGLKPSKGRVSQGPLIGDSWAGATIDGVVSRSVRDSAKILDIISGRRVGDPYTASPPARPFTDELGVDPGTLRIGLAPTVGDYTTHPECLASIEATGELLTSLGHNVEIAQPEAMYTQEFNDSFLVMLAGSTAADLNMLALLIGREFGPDDLEPDNFMMYEIGKTVTAADYLNAVTMLQAWTRQMHSWWTSFDVLVSPVVAAPPPKIGWLSDPELGQGRLLEFLIFTAQFNISGQPAVSLPLHWTDDGLPVGVQFVGGIDDEATLIRLSSQIEAAAPWAHKLPPIFG